MSKPSVLCRLTGLFLLAVALAGCGAAAATPSSSEQPDATAATVAQAPILPPRAIAVREGRIDEQPVTLELTQLRRRGKVVNLELRLWTKTAVEVDVDDAFDDGVPQNISDPAATRDFEFTNSLDGINLIDGVNGRRFAPARDRYNHCICDRDVDVVYLSRERPLTLSATFGAPPANVKAVDVVFPRFGTVADVPLG